MCTKIRGKNMPAGWVLGKGAGPKRPHAFQQEKHLAVSQKRHVLSVVLYSVLFCVLFSVLFSVLSSVISSVLSGVLPRVFPAGETSRSLQPQKTCQQNARRETILARKTHRRAGEKRGKQHQRLKMTSKTYFWVTAAWRDGNFANKEYKKPAQKKISPVWVVSV